jgi:serine/threonine protein kinase
MPVAVEQFVTGLVQAGIVSPDRLGSLRERLPADRQHDAQELARELLRQKVLTKYQVQEAYRGKAKDLVLGNYTILDKIGEGGMGRVFRAQHRHMDRIVAIKLLPAAVTNDQAAAARFQREVKAAAKMSHPNIVTAYDADQANGVHFLVMECVEGTDLSALVKMSGPLPADQALGCVVQAARGLAYAHGQRVVHRDIKPANLLLDRKGAVKVLDMGLARFDSASVAGQAELTGTGQIMGTVDYMSPEQALDTRHADERSDIYSLGCTLWYLLTGRAVFGGENIMERLLAHREQPVPALRSACPAATRELETVFTKMVAKQPHERYTSMSDVIAALERCRVGEDSARGTPAPALTDPSDESRFAEFLREIDSMRRTKTATKAAAKKAATAPRLEATVAFQPAKSDTDANLERQLAPPQAPEPTRQWGPRPPWLPRGTVLATVGAAAMVLLLAAAVFYIETRDGAIRVEIHDPQIEVAIKGTQIVLKQADCGRDVRLSPDDKTLVVERGDFKFETNKLLLKKGDVVTVEVVLLTGRIEVRHGKRLIGEGRLPARWRGWPADAPPPAIAPFDATQAKEHQQAWAKYLNVDVECENALGMKLRLVPPGDFVMGSPQEEVDMLAEAGKDQWWKDHVVREAPRHPVYLTKPFYLGVYEVTQEQYQKVTGENPSHFSADGAGKESVKGLNTGEHPVEMASWFDAVDFCNKLSEKEGMKPYYFTRRRW